MFEKPRVSASLAQQPNRIKEIKCLVERTSADLTWKIRKCELVRQTCEAKPRDRPAAVVQARTVPSHPIHPSVLCNKLTGRVGV